MEFLSSKLKKAVSGKKIRYQQDGFDLDLTYITDRIIAMGFPSSGTESVYRNPIEEVIKFFDKYHKNNFKIYNLCSERDYDVTLFENRVEKFPFDDHNPPPLLSIYYLMEKMNLWLSKDKSHIIAVHCKAGKGRTGMIIACFLIHCNYLNYGTAPEALKFFGEIRTKNGQGVTIPSQRRFVRYYEYSLKYGFPLEDRLIQLISITLNTVPSFDQDGGSDPYIIILNLKGDELYDSRKFFKPIHHKPTEKPIILNNLDPILSGDFKIVLWDYDLLSKDDKMCWFWLNSNFITGKIGETTKMELTRESIDNVVKDKKFKSFTEDFKINIEFKILSDGKRKKIFSSNPSNLGNPRNKD